MSDGNSEKKFAEQAPEAVVQTKRSFSIIWVVPIIALLIGGWLADNYLGQRKSIIAGGTLMAAGQFMLGTPHAWIPGQEALFFYVGLGLLIAGNGLFKPNISTMVGDLYGEGDHRRDGAFTIFYMGINVGAFLSGIVVGSVVAAFGGNWQAGPIAFPAETVAALLEREITPFIWWQPAAPNKCYLDRILRHDPR